MERVADHAVNLAEWTIFMITGEHKKRHCFKKGLVSLC